MAPYGWECGRPSCPPALCPAWRRGVVTAAQSRTHRGAPWPRPLMSRGQAGAQALRGQLALGAFPSFSPGPANGCRWAVSLVSRCSLSSSRNPAFRGLRRGTLSAACLPAPSAHCAPWSRHRFCCAPGPACRSRSPGPRGSAVCDRPAWTSPCDPACPRWCHLSRGRLPAVQIWGRAPKRQRSPSRLPTQPLWASAVDATGQTQALTPGRWFTLPVP